MQVAGRSSAFEAGRGGLTPRGARRHDRASLAITGATGGLAENRVPPDRYPTC